MSEEFKKEEINGEAAEKTKAAEHTEEVKAETTAEQSAAETEKPQETEDGRKENDNLQLGESENQRKDRRGE